MTLTNDLERTRRDRALLDELIADPRRLGPDFQPIRRLADDTVIAYKATGRGQAGTELADTLSLLEAAQGLGVVERLDWAFRCLAFDVALDAGLQAEVHLTPEPETYGSACPPRLAVSFGRGRRSLTVGAELHTQAFDDSVAMRRAVDEWREYGWKVVVADVADREDALALIPVLRPDYVQVDMSLPGRSAGGTLPAVRRLISSAVDSGAQVMAIRCDVPSRRGEAADLGATCARGLALGAPGPLPSA
jgi:EAL domain-containing protein (putative c-di-GMP-specific phosphodiesterase class I)